VRNRQLVFVIVLLGATLTVARAQSATTPTMAEDDRIRLAEVFALASSVGDSLWPGWSRAPFAVLLVTPSHEFLVRHPRPTTDFTEIGYDSSLQSAIFVRPRKFSPNLLATFPAVAGVPTIVVGQPARTARRSTSWVLTLMHEHFHQLQYDRPDYYPGVTALNLARGDDSGMWMLNHPFPYDSARVQLLFSDMMRIATDGRSPDRAGSFRAARDRLRAALSADDDRYLGFQLWQEGVARYTEYRIASLAARRHTPSAAFRALTDYESYDTTSRTLRREIVDGARRTALAGERRVAFYSAGAAIALMLDDDAPQWRRHYFTKPFSLDGFLP
jgi:hypothetical protein